LVDRYHGRIMRLAQSVVTRYELAEEIAQETWIAVLRGAERFEGRSSVRSWLFTIYVNRARSASGREFRMPPIDATSPTVDPSRFSSSGQWLTPPEGWSANVDDRLIAVKLAAEAHAAIANLPEVQRARS
jgi:RNA polymerase sigma-70 factor, ECF subfamily